MLHPDTAMHAIRILGVDVANTMTQNAVYQATIEELLELSVQIDVNSWREPEVAEGEAPPREMLVPNSQLQVVHQILNLIAGMR
jgi:hypothetical protein